MFTFARARRPKRTPAEPLADQPPAEPPAASFWPGAALRRLPEQVLLPVFRVGEYEVGEGFCPRLCGHPGIRY